MIETLGLIDVRRQAAHRRLGSQSLLEWIVRRATEAQQLDAVVVVAPAGQVGDMARDLVPTDVPVMIADEADALNRVVAAIDEYASCQGVVRIRDNCPFLDPALIDGLVATAQQHPECAYISYGLRSGQPAIRSTLGVFAEYCRPAALRRAAREAKDPTDRLQVTRYLIAHPETFQLRLMPVPAQLDRDDIRLTVTSDEDHVHAQAIIDSLEPEQLDWQGIARFLDQHPQLRQRMETLNRAQSVPAGETF